MQSTCVGISPDFVHLFLMRSLAYSRDESYVGVSALIFAEASTLYFVPGKPYFTCGSLCSDCNYFGEILCTQPEFVLPYIVKNIIEKRTVHRENAYKCQLFNKINPKN